MRQKRSSLRWQLVTAFAGVSVLTAAMLTVGLLAMLSDYYARTETAFLRQAAARVLDDPVNTLSGPELDSWTIRAALAAQTRVRVLDEAGNTLADSGSPTSLDPSMIQGFPGLPGSTGEMPSPPVSTAAGSSDTATSLRVLEVKLPASANIPGGYLLLSEAPAQGPAVLQRVTESSLIAGLLAVTVAALVGYLLARRISRPLVNLTYATDRMAGGDMSVRANAAGSEEMHQLGESFNAMVVRTGATMDALRRFVADAAHELGTPLTALQTDIQLVARTESTTEAHRLAERAFAQARRLNELTVGLLELSRIEGGIVRQADGSNDLCMAIREAADLVASRAEQANLTFEIEVCTETLLVCADQARLRTIALNLLDNAVKFTPEGGTISVRAYADPDSAVMTVWDTGPGVPRNERDRVFSRFHRTQEAYGVPGSGLGLAIVKAAVENAHGTVVIDDTDVGARFTVRLPLGG